MNNFFVALMLVAEVTNLVAEIRVMLALNTLNGAGLYAAIQPVLSTLQQLNSKIAVPAALAQSICGVIAETVVNFYRPNQIA